MAGADAELLAAIGSLATAPLRRAYAARVLSTVGEPGETWHAGYCPICGGWPLLGELRGVERAEWLRCAACGSGWRIQRLVCPYCDNDDYRSLGRLTVEGEQRFHVATCERCRGYLKVGNAFDPPPSELLALDDVASMHLDVAAIERGYQRPVGSGFTIELAVPDDEWVEELA
jgi:FdhE protein